MNRTVKFRAWDGHGVFGSGPHMLSDVGLTCYVNDWSGDPSWLQMMGQVYINPEMAGFVLMQATGLVDREGQAVYEGDVIEEEGRVVLFEVFWDEDGAGFQKRPLGDWSGDYVSGLRDMRLWRVVGNIYEVNNG